MKSLTRRHALTLAVIAALTASACLTLAVHPAPAGARSRPPVRGPHGGPGPRARLSHRTLTVTGTARADRIEVRERRGHPAIARILVDGRRAPLLTVARARLARIRIEGGAGPDTIAVRLPAHVWSRVSVDIAGQAGNDTLAGDGHARLSGGGGNDSVAFTGSPARDQIALTATGTHTLLTDQSGGVRLVLNGVEHVAVVPLGGRDTLTVGNLAQSGVHTVTEDLAGSAGGHAADRSADRTIIDGSAAADRISIAGSSAGATVTGLAATVSITDADTAGDVLQINGADGNDTVSAGPGALALTVDGGAGADTAAFAVSTANANLMLNPDVSDAVLSGIPGGPATDLTGVESVAVGASGPGDSLAVGDLSPTAVRAVTEDLAGTPAGGDQTVLAGTESGDPVAVAEAAGVTTVTGLPATVAVLNADPSVETLQIHGLGGDDSFTVTGPGALPLQIDGGVGANTASFAVSTADASLDLVASGPEAILTGGAATAMSSIATVHFATTGPDDDLAVGDLAGTSVTAVSQDLAGTTSGSGRTTVSATGGPDAVTVSGEAGSARVTGIPAPVTITDADPAIESVTVDGLGGADTISASTLSAGSPPLTIAGGPGDDTLTGSPQGDRFEWNAGDGNDRVDGGGGADTLAFTGADADENVALASDGTHAALSDDVGSVALDLQAIERIDVAAGGGNDTLTIGDLTGTGVHSVQNDLATPGAAPKTTSTDQTIVNGTAAPDTISIAGGNGTATISGLAPAVSVVHGDPSQDGVTVNSLAGADTITAAAMGSGGPALTLNGDDDDDTITGGAGDDLVDGGRGNDRADLGDGNDRFVWDPGDGSDAVEGGAGTDTLGFHGSNASEKMAVSANGARVRFTRDVGAVTMDLDAVEGIDLSSLAGSDALNVGDTTGTGLGTIIDDEASAVGGTEPASGAHSVVVNGTGTPDTVNIAGAAGAAGSATVSGLATTVSVADADPATAALTVNGLAGADTISAASTTSGGVPVTINGGDDDDTITGGPGDDVVDGGRGNDVASLGGGNDQFVWNPGDGSDTVDGGAGNDRLMFNGANVSEKFTIAANGQRVRLTRDVANITMDLNALEEIDVASLGGADTMSVGDLSGTGVTRVVDDLGALGGGADGQADTVTVNGTSGADTIFAADLGAGGVRVTGLAAEVDVAGADPTLDVLALNGLAGDDSIDATAMTTGSMLLREDGGDGNDLLLGGAGNDIITGDAGDDILIGGPGSDVLDGGTGNNTLIQ
jgi:Ca2+-binding RTX toxin-like protein